jgi:hypothetical protein
MDRLRSRVVKHVVSQWPRTLEDWDRFQRRLSRPILPVPLPSPPQAIETEILIETVDSEADSFGLMPQPVEILACPRIKEVPMLSLSDPMAFVNLAKNHNIPQILPAAQYLLVMSMPEILNLEQSWEFNQITSGLSDISSWEQLELGWRREKLISEVGSILKKSCSCFAGTQVDNYRTSRTMHSAPNLDNYKRVRLEMLDQGDPLAIVEDLPKYVPDFGYQCGSCRQDVTKSPRGPIREKIWEAVLRIYGEREL